MHYKERLQREESETSGDENVSSYLCCVQLTANTQGEQQPCMRMLLNDRNYFILRYLVYPLLLVKDILFQMLAKCLEN